MTHSFSSVEEAFIALGNPSDPAWGAAFAYLSAHAETAELMLETFRETLEVMGVEPSGRILPPASRPMAFGTSPAPWGCPSPNWMRQWIRCRQPMARSVGNVRSPAGAEVERPELPGTESRR